MKVLQIKSSILGDNSKSSEYSELVLNKIKEKNASVELKVRDLAKDVVIPLTGETLGQRSDENSVVSKQHNELIDELKNADVLVLATPVYNFQVPSTILNYFDAVAQAGKTFNYTENGQVGYVKARAIIVLTSGGAYRETQSFREDYLRTVLGFLGVKNVEFLYVEGLAMGATKEKISQDFSAQLEKIGL